MSDIYRGRNESSVIKRHSSVRQTGVRAPRAETGSSSSRPVLWSLLVLVASLGLLGAILSGFFRVREVQVVGTNLPRQQIVQVSGVVGENIFSVRSDEVVNRLDSVGEVAVQRVDTSLPGQVTIYARRRVAMVAWKHDNALYLLDPDGRVISQVSATGLRLPIITSVNGGNRLGPGVVAAVREAVRVVPSAPHGAIDRFTFDNRNGLTIVAVAGWRAFLGMGSPETMATRVVALVDVLNQVANRPNLQWVELRGPSPHAHFSQ